MHLLSGKLFCREVKVVPPSLISSVLGWPASCWGSHSTKPRKRTPLESAKCCVDGQGHQGQCLPVGLVLVGQAGKSTVAAFLAVEAQVQHTLSGCLLCASPSSGLGAREGQGDLVFPRNLDGRKMKAPSAGLGKGNLNTCLFSRELSRGLLQSSELRSNPTCWLRKEISTVYVPGHQFLQ